MTRLILRASSSRPKPAPSTPQLTSAVRLGKGNRRLLLQFMRVGVYIDGFNLYYGGKFLCGPGTSGWRWLDLRALPSSLIGNHAPWTGVVVERIVYCTARISARDNAQGSQEQDVYLRALNRGRVVDHIEYGNYVNRTARAPLATPGKRNRPILTAPGGPVMVQNGAGQDDPDARFVSVARREEKGSDVNVAAHLLWDVLKGQPGQQPVEGAVVISNDSVRLATSTGRWLPSMRAAVTPCGSARAPSAAGSSGARLPAPR